MSPTLAALSLASSLLLLSPFTSAAPSPSPTASSSAPAPLPTFSCTPLDFSQLRAFPQGSALYLADILSFALSTNEVVPLGFNGSSPNATLGRVAEGKQHGDEGVGYWGFESCTGLEGIDTTSTTPGLQKLFGHVVYTPSNTTLPTSSPTSNHTCLTIQTPNATDYSHLALVAAPCNYTSGALADQRGSIFELLNYVNNENSLFLLGPGPAGFNVSYAAGPDSFNATTGTGLDLIPTGLSAFSKFFFKSSNATY